MKKLLISASLVMVSYIAPLQFIAGPAYADGEEITLPQEPASLPSSRTIVDKIISSRVLPDMIGGAHIPGQETPSNPTQKASPSAPGVRLTVTTP